MSALSGSQDLQETFGRLPSKPDEAGWQAWIAKSRTRERRNAARRVKLVKIVSIAVLLATAVLWSKVAEFETIVRFAVVIGAVMVIFQAFHARRYALVALFGAIALLYNPVVRAFSFTDEWQRGVVAASSLPFIGSLFWHDVRTT